MAAGGFRLARLVHVLGAARAVHHRAPLLGPGCGLCGAVHQRARGQAQRAQQGPLARAGPAQQPRVVSARVQARVQRVVQHARPQVRRRLGAALAQPPATARAGRPQLLQQGQQQRHAHARRAQVQREVPQRGPDEQLRHVSHVALSAVPRLQSAGGGRAQRGERPALRGQERLHSGVARQRGVATLGPRGEVLLRLGVQEGQVQAERARGGVRGGTRQRKDG